MKKTDEETIAKKILSDFDLQVSDGYGVDRVALANKMCVKLVERFAFTNEVPDKNKPKIGINLFENYKSVGQILGHPITSGQNKFDMWIYNEFSKPAEEIRIFKHFISHQPKLEPLVGVTQEQQQAHELKLAYTSSYINLFNGVRSVMMMDKKVREAVYEFRRKQFLNVKHIREKYKILNDTSYEKILDAIITDKTDQYVIRKNVQNVNFLDDLGIEEKENFLNTVLLQLWKDKKTELDFFYNKPLHVKAGMLLDAKL